MKSFVNTKSKDYRYGIKYEVGILYCVGILLRRFSHDIARPRDLVLKRISHHNGSYEIRWCLRKQQNQKEFRTLACYKRLARTTDLCERDALMRSDKEKEEEEFLLFRDRIHELIHSLRRLSVSFEKHFIF